MRRGLAAFLVVALATACASRAPATVPGTSPALALPKSIASSVLVLTPDTPEYARADVASATRPAGEGNVSRSVAIQLTRDITVYRLWNGPSSADPDARTNRIGSWWTFDPPTGSQADYRKRYEICTAWNTLAYVASCTLRKDSVVAVGPGNSVSAETCANPTRAESYPANRKDWQLYVAGVRDRIGPGRDLECPDPSDDYAADPRNLAKRRAPKEEPWPRSKP